MLQTHCMRILCGLLLLSLISCSGRINHHHGVYLLVDTSGTYANEIDKARQLIDFLLINLEPGDTLAVAKIDSASFSEKDIVAKATFHDRPSRANQQKREFKQKIVKFVKKNKGSTHTDITGGIIQAALFLQETGAGRNTIVIFSDLKEEIKKGYKRDFPISLKGMKVIAVNVTKLMTDNVDPRLYTERLERWKQRVEKGGGSWRTLNDMEKLDALLRG